MLILWSQVYRAGAQLTLQVSLQVEDAARAAQPEAAHEPGAPGAPAPDAPMRAEPSASAVRRDAAAHSEVRRGC